MFKELDFKLTDETKIVLRTFKLSGIAVDDVVEISVNNTKVLAILKKRLILNLIILFTGRYMAMCWSR